MTRSSLTSSVSRPAIAGLLAVFVPLTVVGCSGCASPRNSARHIPIARDVFFDLLPPSSLGRSISLEQIVEGRRGEHASAFHCLLEVDDEELVLVGLTPFGTRAFVLTLCDGRLHVENTSGQDLPAEPARILADLQLALWTDLPSLPGLEVVERKGTSGKLVRELRHDGQLVIRVTYENAVHWQGNLRFEHLEQGYELEVRTLRAESLSP